MRKPHIVAGVLAFLLLIGFAAVHLLRYEVIVPGGATYISRVEE